MARAQYNPANKNAHDNSAPAYNSAKKIQLRAQASDLRQIPWWQRFLPPAPSRAKVPTLVSAIEACAELLAKSPRLVHENTFPSPFSVCRLLHTLCRFLHRLCGSTFPSLCRLCRFLHGCGHLEVQGSWRCKAGGASKCNQFT